jgi:hypothetical protein
VRRAREDAHILLRPGEPLTAEDRDHLAGCRICRALLEGASALPAAAPGPSAALIEAVRSGLRPVKPIAGLPALTLCFALVLLVVLAAGAVLTGTAGYAAQTPMTRALMFSILAAGAVLFSYTLAQRMIPGSLVRVRLWPMALVVCAAFLLAVLLLFHDTVTWQGLEIARGCLGIGLAAAVLTALGGWLVMRRGAGTENSATAISLGALSGVSALLVLTVHCPVLRASHILVWHGGAVAATMLAAWLAAAVVRRKGSGPDSSPQFRNVSANHSRRGDAL